MYLVEISSEQSFNPLLWALQASESFQRQTRMDSMAFLVVTAIRDVGPVGIVPGKMRQAVARHFGTVCPRA